jgi:NAD+ diphosphatase
MYLMPKKFTPYLEPPTSFSNPALWFAFSGDNLLIYDRDETDLIPILTDFVELGLSSIRQQFLGFLDEQPCFSLELAPDAVIPTGLVLQGLRQVFMRLDETLGNVAGRAFQIMDWDRNHQFCGRCGTKTELSQMERVRKCPKCGLHSYPRLSPSIIVAVRREAAILLARGHGFPPGLYSVVAGFVEPGETLEETVSREVFEETGLEVKNVHYFASQPWPFPNSLMLGFTAEYAGGELRLDETEIEDARWFTRETLPQIPPKFTIARHLIDAFIEGRS